MMHLKTVLLIICFVISVNSYSQTKLRWYPSKSTKKIDDSELERTEVRSTVTLAVPFEDSLKIQTASAVGKITLALRNSGDMNGQGNVEFEELRW